MRGSSPSNTGALKSTTWYTAMSPKGERGGDRDRLSATEAVSIARLSTSAFGGVGARG